MTKLKLYIIIGLCLVSIALLIHHRAGTLLPAQPGKPQVVQTVRSMVEVPKNVAIVKKPEIRVVTVNKRGDKQLEPITITVSKNNEEIPIIITPNDFIINVINSWKCFGGVVYHPQNGTYKATMGVCYEVYHLRDFNFDVGVGLNGLLLGVGYNFTQNTEVLLGYSLSDKSTTLGLGIRL